ncbi:hypothetical protein TNCV_2270441 [Trichonephila clavipes]|nr:hypothetical protein TNCV_2270441 [Trichonephila clavipes]
MGSHIGIHGRAETLFRHGSDDTKYKKDIGRIKEENMFIILRTAKRLRTLWLVYIIDGATWTEASDDGACSQVVFPGAFPMKIHFTSRLSGGRMKRCTNVKPADMHLVYRNADCNGRIALRSYSQSYTGGKLLANISLYSSTRYCPIADPSWWAHWSIGEVQDRQTWRRLFWSWYRTIPVLVSELLPVMSGFAK